MKEWGQTRREELFRINKDMAALQTIRAEKLNLRRIMRVLEWKERRLCRRLGIESCT